MGLAVYLVKFVKSDKLLGYNRRSLSEHRVSLCQKMNQFITVVAFLV